MTWIGLNIAAGTIWLGLGIYAGDWKGFFLAAWFFFLAHYTWALKEDGKNDAARNG